MAICTCGGYGEPKVEGHWLGCASWQTPSFAARLTPAEIEQRDAAVRRTRMEQINALEAEAAHLRAGLDAPHCRAIADGRSAPQPHER